MSPQFWEALAVYAPPVLPLSIGWWKLLRRRSQVKPTHWLIPALATASMAWLLLGCFFPFWFGPSYTNLRFGIIAGNFLLVIVVAFMAFTRRPKPQPWIGIACLMLSSVWAFLFVLNSVV